MKNILVLCPTPRELRDIPALAERLGYRIIWDEFGGDYFDDLLVKNPEGANQKLDILELIDSTIEKYKDSDLAGVTSAVGYPGMSATAIIAQRMGLPGPKPHPILLCEHKYY